MLDRFRDSVPYHCIRRLARRMLPPEVRFKLADIGYKVRALFETHRWGMFSTVAIETTTRCNRRCDICPHQDPEKRRRKTGSATVGEGIEMEPALFSDILRQLSVMGFKGKIALHGYGEPLLDGRLLDRIREARRILPEVYITINSNGDLFNDLDCDELKVRLIELKKSGLSHIYITDHTHNTKRRENMKAKLKRITEETPELRGFASYYTVLSKLRNRGGAVDRKLFERYVEEGIVAGPKDRDMCISVINSLNITVDGKVIPCPDDYEMTDVMGDLRERSIEEIWFSDSFRQARSEIRRRIFRLGVCRRCNIGLDSEI